MRNSNVYIVEKGVINVRAVLNTNINKKHAILKTKALSRLCITKFSNTLLDNTEDLHILIIMYNLLDYGHDCTMTLGSLCNYSSDEIDSVDEDVLDYKSFKHKKQIGKLPVRPPKLNHHNNSNHQYHL